MHSYLKETVPATGLPSYVVGLWLRHEDSSRFQRLFEVSTREQAFRAVNVLNGGDGDAMIQAVSQTVVHEY